MSHSKFQILPQNLIQQFYHSFSIYSLLMHLHSMTKSAPKFQITATYNFSVFLTLDKSRKIIRKKEDEFVADMVRRVQLEAKLLVSKHVNQKELYKITYTELQKFIELLEERKSQLSYFEKSAKKVEKLFNLDEKQKTKNQQTIKRIKNKMDESYENLSLVFEKYKEKTHLTLVGRLKLKMSPKFSDIKQSETFQQNKKTEELYAHQENCILEKQKMERKDMSQNTIDKPFTFQRSGSKKKTKVLKKFGDVSVQNQKIQNLKRKISSLKTKYHKMNCKTEMNRTQDDTQNYPIPRHANRMYTLQTCADSDVDNLNTIIKDQQTNASQVKYSIRLTQEKKLSKMNNTFFSIFDKKTHQASFILKNPSKAGYDANEVIHDEIQQTQKIIPGQFLRSRSSLFKNLPGSIEGLIPKKAINSVYRQTNFAFEAQQKVHQKRVSTAKPKPKPRQNLRLQTEPKQYILRTSQTEAKIEEDFDPKHQINFDFEAPNDKTNEEPNDEVMPVEQEKLLPQLDEDENNVELVFCKDNDKKGNNRRKGFSKKNITTEYDFDSDFAPSAVSIKKKSQMWIDTSKPQKSYNRTSFFRSSGYIHKKSVMETTKTRFNNLSKKLYRHHSKDVTSQLLIEPINTQKTIKAIVLQRDRKKKAMKFNHMTITAKDCKQLYQDIKGQWRLDEMSLHPGYLSTIMRQKYDLRYKSRQDDEQNDDGCNPFRNQRRMLTQKDNQRDEGIGKWSSSKVDNDEVQFMRTVSRKFNQLGQKDLGVCPFWDNDVECINF